MADITYKSNGTPENKPRIYFTCHPDDRDKYLEKIAEDIYKTHDCVIYYTKNMTEALTEENKTLDIGRSNLLVVPVTFKLLTDDNRAMLEDIPYAKSINIPILPIMMETGLNSIYKRPDRFGELQYLSPYSEDSTAISYSEKLKRHLESVLIGKELSDRIIKAFDAYVFLSYRKKDRAYANELMRLIHSNPELRDVAIWFDEFLTPGESFKKNIEKMLDNCDLFTLLVTPNIFGRVKDDDGREVDNYVVSTELPLARRNREEKGTNILAVEMESTDLDRLKSIEIDSVIHTDEDFKARFIDSLSKTALAENDGDPEHNFLIGLAYLEGIDVETDRERAVELITSAAENGLAEAMKKLHSMYENGIGVPLNYNTSLHWANALYEHYLALCGEEHRETVKASQDLVASYHYASKPKEALALIERLYPIQARLYKEGSPEHLEALELLAYSYSANGQPEMALRTAQRSYELHCSTLGEKNIDTLVSLCNLASIYGENKMYEKALELDKKAYALRLETLGEKHPDTLNSLANLAATHGQNGDSKTMLELCNKAYTLQCEIMGSKHPNTLTVLSNLASAYKRCNQPEKALELCEQVYTLRREVLGREHTDTELSLRQLVQEYKEYGCQEKIIALLEGGSESDKLWISVELAYALYNSNKADVALGHFEKAYRLACEEKGNEAEDTVTLINDIGTAYFMLGEYKKALKHFERAHALRVKLLSGTHKDTLLSLECLANTYYALEKYDKAVTSYERLIAQGYTSPAPSTFTANLAYSYNMTGNYERSAGAYARLYEISLGNSEDEEFALLNQAINLNELGRTARSAKPIFEGIRILKRLRAMQADSHGEDSTEVKETDSYLRKLRDNASRL